MPSPLLRLQIQQTRRPKLPENTGGRRIETKMTGQRSEGRLPVTDPTDQVPQASRKRRRPGDRCQNYQPTKRRKTDRDHSRSASGKYFRKSFRKIEEEEGEKEELEGAIKMEGDREFSDKVFLNRDVYAGNFKGIFPHGKGKYTW
ncbi:unnamed protein product [Camellia sinensis]